jgi:hypothetical protein
MRNLAEGSPGQRGRLGASGTFTGHAAPPARQLGVPSSAARASGGSGGRVPCPNCGAPGNGGDWHPARKFPHQCTIPYCCAKPGEPHVTQPIPCPRLGARAAGAYVADAEAVPQPDEPVPTVPQSGESESQQQMLERAMLIVDQQIASTDGRLAQANLSDAARETYQNQRESLDVSRAELEIGLGRLVADEALGRPPAAPQSEHGDQSRACSEQRCCNPDVSARKHATAAPNN